MTLETAARRAARAAPAFTGAGPVASPSERWVAILGGTALAVAGVRRGDWTGLALAAAGGGLAFAGAAGLPVADSLREMDLSRLPLARLPLAALPADRTPTTTQATVTIMAPAEKIFRYWRNFTNQPKLMDHLDTVEIESATHSVWKARGPGGMPVQWRSEIDKERENELLSWHTVDGDLPHRGQVMFKPAPGGRGTEVRFTMVYRPPGGQGGRAVAKLFGTAPEQQAHEALRRLKQIMETGGIPTIEGQPHGNRGNREARE